MIDREGKLGKTKPLGDRDRGRDRRERERQRQSEKQGHRGRKEKQAWHSGSHL